MNYYTTSSGTVYQNKNNLPHEICKSLTRDRYNRNGQDIGDYSATTLIAPIQQTILKRRYPEKLTVRDVIDNFWMFTGSIAHTILEEAGHDEALVEKRFYATVLGKTISGSVDHYRNHTITDYKTTKAYKIIKNDFSDWEKQLNIYAWLASENGHPVKQVKIYAFILDWKENETYKQGYPQTPIVEVPLRLWSTQETERYIFDRVTRLILAQEENDQRLSEEFACSEKEQWSDVKDWAVMNGGKRAVKVFDNEEDAKAYPLKKGQWVEKRMTARTRCLYHCPISNICQQNLTAQPEEGEPPIF